jgi:hypothetical protein
MEVTACHLLLLVSCLVCSLTLKMEVICSSETLGLSKLHSITTQKPQFQLQRNFKIFFCPDILSNGNTLYSLK